MRKKRTGNLWKGAGLGKRCCYVGCVRDGNVGLKHEKERNRSERQEEAKEASRRNRQRGQRKRSEREKMWSSTCGRSAEIFSYTFPELPTIIATLRCWEGEVLGKKDNNSNDSNNNSTIGLKSFYFQKCFCIYSHGKQNKIRAVWFSFCFKILLFSHRVFNSIGAREVKLLVERQPNSRGHGVC